VQRRPLRLRGGRRHDAGRRRRRLSCRRATWIQRSLGPRRRLGRCRLARPGAARLRRVDPGRLQCLPGVGRQRPVLRGRTAGRGAGLLAHPGRRHFRNARPGFGARDAHSPRLVARLVNGSPASEPIHLPASHARWRPVVTAESWDAGATGCNDFAYRFGAIRVALRPGGAGCRSRAHCRSTAPTRSSFAGRTATWSRPAARKVAHSRAMCAER
jgi:hypothetical protein